MTLFFLSFPYDSWECYGDFVFFCILDEQGVVDYESEVVSTVLRVIELL